MERCPRSRNALSHVSAVNWITSSGRGEGGREEGRGEEGREEGRERERGGRERGGREKKHERQRSECGYNGLWKLVQI